MPQCTMSTNWVSTARRSAAVVYSFDICCSHRWCGWCALNVTEIYEKQNVSSTCNIRKICIISRRLSSQWPSHTSSRRKSRLAVVVWRRMPQGRKQILQRFEQKKWKKKNCRINKKRPHTPNRIDDKTLSLCVWIVVHGLVYYFMQLRPGAHIRRVSAKRRHSKIGMHGENEETKIKKKRAPPAFDMYGAYGQCKAFGGHEMLALALHFDDVHKTMPEFIRTCH